MHDENRLAAPPWITGGVPEQFTYTYPEDGGVTYQLQWDYKIEWPAAGRPRIRLLAYRSFQRNREAARFDLVEEIWQDIPVNQLVMMNISKHAAGQLYAYAELDGDWRFVDRKLFDGCAEAAKKRFSLASMRQMMQGAPNPYL
jgi:hypothetical protein